VRRGLIRRSGTQRLETGGMIVGMFAQATFDDQTTQLEPGDVLAGGAQADDLTILVLSYSGMRVVA
jgi:Stage II sporulation protein E (SpoIIE)